MVIKSSSHRSQLKNRAEALGRLEALLLRGMKRKKTRKTTAPSPASVRKRIEGKIRRGRIKELRKKIGEDS